MSVAKTLECSLIRKWTEYCFFFQTSPRVKNDEQIQRLSHLNNFCRGRQQSQDKAQLKELDFGNSFIYNDKKKFVYCHVPKVACTTWKKVVLYTLGIVKTHPVNTSLDIVSMPLVPWSYRCRVRGCSTVDTIS